MVKYLELCVEFTLSAVFHNCQLHIYDQPSVSVVLFCVFVVIPVRLLQVLETQGFSTKT